MKEVLTKSFWQGVKKTFYDALEGPLPESTDPQAPAGISEKRSLTSESPPSFEAPRVKSASNEQH